MNIIKILDTFVFRGHRCIVFELLSHDLYSVLKTRKFVGMDLTLVKRIAV
jgi:dual specificity tyrosine-phosphorylation-regulated kinase 1